MKNLLLALLTGLLLYIGWPTSPLTYLLFVAFIPLLWVEKNIRLDEKGKKGVRVLLLAWAAFALFNVTGTWWVKNAHWSGTLATTTINGFLMTSVFLIYHHAARVLGEKRARFALPFIWICVEVLHQDWQISFPWLDLGNALATHVEWIQWYSFTGHMGGSLWIWILNLMLLRALEIFTSSENKKRFYVFLFSRLFIWFIIPVIVSTLMYQSYQDKGEKVNVLVVQPNIDSYTEKFELSEFEQLKKFKELAEPLLNDSIDYLVGPETMLVNAIDEDKKKKAYSINYLSRIQRQFPNLNIVVGAVSYKTFSEKNKTVISRPFSNSDRWYELYNSSLQINASNDIPFYHKSKLVVAAEYMPFTSYLKPLLGDVVLDFGGTIGTHGTQEYRTIFKGNNPAHKVGTVICWEAEFGEFVTSYSRAGANLFFAITNDGWWGDTDGHRQHMHYARIRAIENRRSIARSANTGISCFINQRGDVSQQVGWATDGAIVGTIKANNELTFYSKWGDIVGRVSVLVLILVMLTTFAQGLLKSKRDRT